MRKENIIKLLKEKKILIGCATLIMICGLGLSIALSMQHVTQQSTDTSMKSSETEKETISQYDDTITMNKETQKKADEYARQLQGFEIGKNDGEVITKEKATGIISEARSYIRGAEWQKAYDLIKPLVSTYNLNTDEGVKIQSIYYDAGLVLNLKNLTKDKYAGVFSGFRDAEDLLIATLQIPEEFRRDIFMSYESLSPIYKSRITINDVQENYDGPYLKDAQKSFSEIFSMTKIDFEIEGNKLEGYVVVYEAGNKGLYKIVTPQGQKNFYKTVEDWIKIDEKIQNNIKVREANESKKK